MNTYDPKMQLYKVMVSKQKYIIIPIVTSEWIDVMASSATEANMKGEELHSRIELDILPSKTVDREDILKTLKELTD